MTEALLRIATRKSPLAMWQARYVADRLQVEHPGLKVEILGMATRGDNILDSPLAQIGGKGLFVKELEQGIRRGEADIAVHSVKDVPMCLPPGLHLPVIMQREDPCDAFVSPAFEHPDQLPDGARVGTSSLRRQCQLRSRYPVIQVRMLRGNVNTRLSKLDSGDFDAIILAAAGLKRLGFEERIGHRLEPEISLPAIGQGAMGIECRTGDLRVEELISVLDHEPSHLTVSAERAMNRRLDGSCQTPIAGYAEIEGGRIWLRGLVGHPDGGTIIRAEGRSPVADGEALGVAVAEELLRRGAEAILSDLGRRVER